MIAVRCDLVDMFVDLHPLTLFVEHLHEPAVRALAVQAAQSLPDGPRLMPTTAPSTVSISSMISSEAPHRSCVRSPPGQCSSASETRSSSFAIVGSVSTHQDFILLRIKAHPVAPPRSTASSGFRFRALRPTQTHPVPWRSYCTRCVTSHCTRCCR